MNTSKKTVGMTSQASIMRTLAMGLASTLMASVMASSALATAETKPSAPQVLGFQQWKASRIEEARSALERLQSDIQLEKLPALERSPGDKSLGLKSDKKPDTGKGTGSSLRTQKSTRSDQRLQQAQLNVEIAQELSVDNYFALYLSQFKEREEFIEAAKKLTPEEAAELMMTFQKTFSSAQQVEFNLPAPPSSRGVSSKDKAPRSNRL